MSRSFKNNNPGNLRFSPWTKSKGAKDDGDGYAIFPTLPTGFKTLGELIDGNKYSKHSIFEAMRIYAPVKDKNNPDAYAEFIASYAEVDPTDRIMDLTPIEFFKLLIGIMIFEGWSDA